MGDEDLTLFETFKFESDRTKLMDVLRLCDYVVKMHKNCSK